jgi:hypothetical protein
MKNNFTIQFSPTRLKQIKKIALSGSKAKLKILNGQLEEGFQLLKSTAQKFKSFATDLADRIPQALAVRISLDLFSHFESKSSKRLGIPKGIVLGGVLALMSSLPVAAQVVTSTADAGVGTLRQAILDANGTAADEIILLAEGTTYTISSNLPTVVNNGTLQIICTGTTNAIIEGGNSFRPLTMTTGSNLTLSKITVQNGTALKGGGIYNNNGSLIISNSIITNNEATGAGTDARGGGIYSTGTGGSASVLIQNSTISLNVASRRGGGISNWDNSLLTISSSSISGNTSTNRGGGIYNRDSDNLSISSSSISGNTSNHRGGGIFNRESDNLTIFKSSISGNTSQRSGGGIYNRRSDMTIEASSITLNTTNTNATAKGGGLYMTSNGANTTSIINTTISSNISITSGGGIYAYSSGGGNTLTLQHVTISNNSGTVTGGFANNPTSDLDISLQNTIIGNSIGADISTGTATMNGASTSNIIEDGSLIDGSVSAVDPLLGDLTLNSGFLIHPVETASTAINAGANIAIVTDQVGNPRDVTPHIGAVEVTIPSACSFDVTTNADAGVGSLRQAILDANANLDDCVIYLDGGETYTISSNLPIVTGTDVGGTLTIISTGTLNAVIDGASSFRPLTMTSGSNLTLSNITIQNGFSATSGGGIYNTNGDLSISDCIITQNNSNGGGGGLFSTGVGGNATVLIQNSIISLNTASSGGGIFNTSNSSLTISTSTISENTSNSTGAGIHNQSSSNLGISSSSITGNTSNNSGGGVWCSNSNLSISASVFSSNQATQGAGIMAYGTLPGSSLVQIQNTTISGNNATTGRGGGIYHNNQNNPNDIRLQHVTITHNTGNGAANTGANFANSGNGGNILIQNSIIANSLGNGGDFGNVGAATVIVTASIVEDATVVGAISGDPMLNAFSGGVHSLQTGSIAIDAASTADATSKDQLGVVRVFPHDIGAIEFGRELVACPIDVTSNLDTGLGTLRQAIIDANANISDCVIYLDGGETYTIASNLPIVTGTDVGGTLSIISTGTLNAVIDGASSFRPLTMTTGAKLTISNITIQNGEALKGGGVYNNNGDLTISNCIITNNSAIGSVGRGGGVYSTGVGGTASLLIQNSTISLNSSSRQGAGVHSRDNNILTILSSSILENTANRRGGGVFNISTPKVNIFDSSITENNSTYQGGGIANVFSYMTISSSSITGNTSILEGGGVYNRRSDMTIQASSITQNSTTDRGGGVYFDVNDVNGVDAVKIINTTISSNRSITSGGGIYANSTGAGNSITIQHATISTNSGSVTGGFANNPTSTLNITLQNTIIGDNTGFDFDLATAGIITTASIIESSTTPITSATVTDPLLGALTLNSGFLIHPLKTTSPAIDTGANLFATIPTDQVGNSRDTAPYIGAVEVLEISSVCIVVTAPAGVTNTWIGCTNSDWNTASNWSLESVPTASDIVYIPTVAVNQLIIDEVATCAKMLVQIGAKCLVDYNAGGKLVIKF